MFNPMSLVGTTWLMEPVALRLAIQRVAMFRECPSPRELAKERRKRLDFAAAAPSRAVKCEGTAKLTEHRAGPAAIRAQSGRIGVVDISGPIDQHYTAALSKAGGTSCDEIGMALDSLMADAAVSAIVMHVDSPGGAVSGVGELADRIYDARAKKPIYAISDSMAASAAYWLATAASTMVCTPGGAVGSVGVYSIHADQSEALKAQGINLSVVQSTDSPMKTEFMDNAPLGDQAREYLQKTVDAIHGKFIDALAKNRDMKASAVRSDFGRGRVMMADDALAAKMCDRVMSFADLMGRLTGSGGNGGRASASAQTLAARHSFAKLKAGA